jgi:hypothetical protein
MIKRRLLESPLHLASILAGGTRRVSGDYRTVYRDRRKKKRRKIISVERKGSLDDEHDTLSHVLQASLF